MDFVKKLCIVFVLTSFKSDEINRPNIIIVEADDLGWGDLSLHGSDFIQTPNIDCLGLHGWVLQNYYTDTQDTPSKSSLFTGKYPMRLGTQGESIKAAEDRGVPKAETLLPELLLELGYSTHLVGKWHLGHSRENYLPTNRGFKSFYGTVGSATDYYTYNLIEKIDNGTEFFGLNFFENLTPLDTEKGHFTEVITAKAVNLIKKHNVSSPMYLHVSHAAPHAGGGLIKLQAPVNGIAANNHIAHSARRTYAGMVTTIDVSMGKLVAALAEKDMLTNTLIIFVSDNGSPMMGPEKNFGSNLPLRGTKNTPWEGAVRSTAILWHSKLQSKVWRGLFHVSDWLPTLVAAGGGDVTGHIDGINQWDTFIKNQRSRRNELLVTVDDLKGWAAIRQGDYKFIVGNVPSNVSGYYGEQYNVLCDDVPNYEKALLNSLTYRILQQSLNLTLDMNRVLAKRSETKLFTVSNETQNGYCVPTNVKGCLFNITADPLETRDLWNSSPDVVRHLAIKLRTMWLDLVARNPPRIDIKADPALRDYVWLPWVNNDEKEIQPSPIKPPFPLQVTQGELQYLIDLNLHMFKDRMAAYIQNMGQSFVKSIKTLFSG